MNHASQFGFACPPVPPSNARQSSSLDGRQRFALIHASLTDSALRILCAIPSLALGVGNNPDSFSSVQSTNGRRWNNIPFRIVPDVGKAPENSIQSPIKQR
jgi:hypothetical protein